MINVLYVEASPRKVCSASIAAATVFLKALEAQWPKAIIDRLDLWNADLPEFDGALIAAKYARLSGRDFDANEEEAWQKIAALVARLSSADAVVIATPMWNFGIPYKLKHWVDLITQPSLSFNFDPETGYRPLLKPRPTLVILSSAGDYATGTSFGRPDLATPYLTAALAFIGLSGVTVETVAPMSGRTAAVDQARERARNRLELLAGHFLEPSS
jgi:FMN-dependent NADH-azoreductase